MARKISSRLKISGVLQAETPLHVGGYGVDVDTDLPLARNGKGELYVPGTSLAGVLRAWCERNFNEAEIGEIFGPKRQTGIEEGHASFVLIEDAKVTLPKNLQIEIRDGVGIDRFYGTASDQAKFDRAILPRGSKLGFELTVEIQARKEPNKKGKTEKEKQGETEKEFEDRVNETKAVTGHLLSALSNEEIRLGASKTRGLGRVRFDVNKISEEKLLGFNSNESILDLFDESKKSTVSIQKLIDDDKTKTPKPPKAKIEIEIFWKPCLPLMVKAGYEGIGVDMLPVTSGVENFRLSLVLAGSSIKGAFRSHAERIVRTLLNIETPNSVVDSQNFSKQIQMLDKNGKDSEKASILIGEIFGAKKENEDKNKPSSKLGLSALAIDDCYSVECFDQEKWREVEQTAEDEDETYRTFWNKLNDVQTDKLKFHPTHHTAIDRFTGGAAEGALYSVLAPQTVEWNPIKMTLDFARTENDLCCLMLLLLILRDLAQNRLPLGFAVNRGMGEIQVEKIEVTGGYKITWTNEKFVFSDENQKDIMTEEWQKWAS